jgi:hypothetical protein
MTRTKLAFLAAAASTLALTAQGANAASLNPVTGVLAAKIEPRATDAWVP